MVAQTTTRKNGADVYRYAVYRCGFAKTKGPAVCAHAYRQERLEGQSTDKAHKGSFAMGHAGRGKPFLLPALAAGLVITIMALILFVEGDVPTLPLLSGGRGACPPSARPRWALGPGRPAAQAALVTVVSL